LTLMVGIVGAANASGFGRARPGSWNQNSVIGSCCWLPSGNLLHSYW
jgi:hypothetical protein